MIAVGWGEGQNPTAVAVGLVEGRNPTVPRVRVTLGFARLNPTYVNLQHSTPLATANPILGVLGLGVLELGVLELGVLGLGVLGLGVLGIRPSTPTYSDPLLPVNQPGSALTRTGSRGQAHGDRAGQEPASTGRTIGPIFPTIARRSRIPESRIPGRCGCDRAGLRMSGTATPQNCPVWAVIPSRTFGSMVG
jgi:hypothetical protein